MFHFFNTVLHSIATFIVSTLIVSGLATAPTPKTDVATSTATQVVAQEAAATTTSNAPTKATEAVAPPHNVVRTSAPTEPQPRTTLTPQTDYKLQTLAILNGAKNNYSHESLYITQGNQLVTSRIAFIRNLYDSNNAFVNSLSDPTWQQIWMLYGQLLQQELKDLNSYLQLFAVALPTNIQSHMNELSTLVSTVQNSDKPVTYDQMMSYQVTYFGTGLFQNDVDSLTAQITKFKGYVDSSNAGYKAALDLIQKKLDKDAAATAASTQFNAPVLVLPQPPVTTNCLVTGDGGVGFATHISCTTY